MPELSPGHTDALRRGCETLGLNPGENQYASWLRYLEFLLKWNRAYNLTAVRDPGEMVIRHLLDSLSIASYLPGERLVDVGTGAGLPGVPLAVLFPERDIHVLDSNGKKTRFLFQVKTGLGLDNMTIHHGRVESYHPREGFDVVLSRAFASLQDMVVACSHLLRPGGRFMAMKGTVPSDELLACGDLCEVMKVSELHVPGLAEERHLVELAPR